MERFRKEFVELGSDGLIDRNSYSASDYFDIQSIITKGEFASGKGPLISVIVPVYNVERYLRKCLDSIINQTFSNIEIICVNDGSKDSSLSIIKEYAARDKRIVVVDKENGGLSSARNAGLDIARGDYISFVDRMTGLKRALTIQF